MSVPQNLILQNPANSLETQKLIPQNLE